MRSNLIQDVLAEVLTMLLKSVFGGLRMTVSHASVKI